LRLTNINNSLYSEDLKDYIKREVAIFKNNLDQFTYKDDPILQGFHLLHVKVGMDTEEFPSSSEWLRYSLATKDKFPVLML